MSTLETQTLTVTINAPMSKVAEDLADPLNHPKWGTEFFAGEATRVNGNEARVQVPMMGGETQFKVEAKPEIGYIDLYLAPAGQPYADPLPVRLLENGSGVDVLWRLTRFPGIPEQDWIDGLASMQRELGSLKSRMEKALAS